MFKREIKKAKGVFSDSTKSAGVAIDVGLYSVKCATFEKGLLTLNEFPLFDEPKDIRMQDQHDLAEVQMNAAKKSGRWIGPNSEIILSPQPSLQVLTKIIGSIRVSQQVYLLKILDFCIIDTESIL